MHIERIETFTLKTPLDEPFGWSQGWAEDRFSLVVKITTDNGLIGWGETVAAPAKYLVDNLLAPILIGENPMNRISIWERMFSCFYLGNSAVGFGACAMSAIDIALWDLAGKATGLPICELLGGRVRDKVAVYATGLYYTKHETQESLYEEARGYVEAGFKGMKTKVGGLPFKKDVERVIALREALGPDISLMIDANQAYTAATAIRMGRHLKDYDILWFEEPVNCQDLEANLQVKAALPMALAGGETLKTRYEFEPYLCRRAFDIVQPDIGLCGGITEMYKISTMANTCGVQVNPHVWASQITLAATVHLTAALPACPQAFNSQAFLQEPVMEFDQTPSGFRDMICTNPLKQEEGFIRVPGGPGLGINVVESVVKDFSIEKEKTPGNYPAR